MGLLFCLAGRGHAAPSRMPVYFSILAHVAYMAIAQAVVLSSIGVTDPILSMTATGGLMLGYDAFNLVAAAILSKRCSPSSLNRNRKQG